MFIDAKDALYGINLRFSAYSTEVITGFRCKIISRPCITNTVVAHKIKIIVQKLPQWVLWKCLFSKHNSIGSPNKSNRNINSLAFLRKKYKQSSSLWFYIILDNSFRCLIFICILLISFGINYFCFDYLSLSSFFFFFFFWWITAVSLWINGSQGFSWKIKNNVLLRNDKEKIKTLFFYKKLFFTLHQ